MADYQDVGCGDSCASCIADGPRVGLTNRVWFAADYLAWQLSGSDLRPLVTASPAGTPLADAGVLGDPTTQTLAGSETVGDAWRSGYRLTAGGWIDDCKQIAIRGQFFDVGQDSYRFAQPADAAMIVTRPFFNSETGADDAELVSAANELDGTVSLQNSDEFRGASISIDRCISRCCQPCGPSIRYDFVAGYRYYQYNSRLAIHEDLTVLAGTTQPLVPGTTIQVSDQFSTRNEFHGGEIGLKGRYSKQIFWIEGLAAAAIGSNRRTVNINGSTINTVPGVGTAEFVGGLLSSEVTNVGHYRDSNTVVIPNFRLSLGCQLTQRLSGHVGYNAIIWNNVAVAAEHLPPGLQVDQRNLPAVQAGGGPEPEFPGIRGTTMVAHGLDLGLEFTY